MGTCMRENILQTRCTALGSIDLVTGIGMRELGTRVKGKGLECTHSEMERLNLVTGKMEFLTFLAIRTQLTPSLLLLFTISKYSMQKWGHVCGRIFCRQDVWLAMGIGMSEPGTRVKGKGLECTHSEMERLNLVTGKMEFLMFLAIRTQLTPSLLLLLTIPKYSMQCRKHYGQQRKHMMWPRWMKG